MITRLFTALPISAYVNYIAFYVWSNRNFLFSRTRAYEPLADFLAGIFSFLFGAFGYVLRLGGSNSPELRSMPAPWILWIAITVTTAVVFFTIPLVAPHGSKILLGLACLPMTIFILSAIIQLV